MRVAIVSDIHGNLTAFEAVLADIRKCSPDLVLHGGDLADSGSSPTEIVDHIRTLGWQGVMGNTDEMLIRPQTLEEFARRSSAPPAMWEVIRAIAAATRDRLGEDRLAWLQALPGRCVYEGFALVHGTPESCWQVPAGDATDAKLRDLYSSLGQPIIIFGHTHRPFLRQLQGGPELLINTGSVGIPYDGDSRASYLLLDGRNAKIRRVEYNVKRELQLLAASDLPGAQWTAKMLRTSSPQMP